MDLKFDVKIDRKLIAAVTKANLKTKTVKIATIAFDLLALFYLVRIIMRCIAHESIIIPAFLFVFILAVFHIALPLMLRAKIRARFKDSHGKTMHYRINDDGLHAKSEFGESRIHWKAVRDVVDLGDYVFILLSGGASAIWLKKDDISAAELDWIRQHPRR